MSKKELQETLKYFKRQMKAMAIRGGDAELYLPRIQSLEKQLAELK